MMRVLCFTLFGLFSILLIIAGGTVKNQLHPTPLKKPIMVGKNKEMSRMIGNFFIIAGVVTALWTITGYLLYDLLSMGIFIIIYLLLMAIIVIIGLIVIWRYYRM